MILQTGALRDAAGLLLPKGLDQGVSATKITTRG
jgi:hypothetical protein